MGSGGPKAYYLTENGEHQWGDLAKSTADSAAKLGLMSETMAEPIDLDSAKQYAGFASLSSGMNSQGQALRARKVLGWNPSCPSLLEELPQIAQSEWSDCRIEKFEEVNPCSEGCPSHSVSPELSRPIDSTRYCTYTFEKFDVSTAVGFSCRG